MSLKNLMILVLSASLAIGVALTGGCVGSETPTQTIKNITLEEASTLNTDETRTRLIKQRILAVKESVAALEVKEAATKTGIQSSPAE